jgi:hypothetical protein
MWGKNEKCMQNASQNTLRKVPLGAHVLIWEYYLRWILNNKMQKVNWIELDPDKVQW